MSFEPNLEQAQHSPVGSSPGVVLVDGATGYLGSHITNALRSLDYPVRCIVRAGANPQDLRLLESTGAQVQEGDFQVSKIDEGDPLFARVQTAIHTIGTVAPKRGESLQSLHADQTKAFVNLCVRNHVSKIIMISSLGTSRDGQTEYHRTKWLAEEVVRQSGIPFVILRPALIIGKMFGRRNSKLVDRYLNLIQKNDSVPLIAGGGNKVQPVFVGDVVSSVVKCLQFDLSSERSDSRADRRIFGQTLELAGPEIVSMREFVEKLSAIVVKQKRQFRTVSPVLARVGAFFCERLQEVPLISADQIKLSLADNIALDNGLISAFGINPTTIDQALSTYTGMAAIETATTAPNSPLVHQD